MSSGFRPPWRASWPRASIAWRRTRRIRRVSGVADDELARMLADLQNAEFIYEQPALPDIEYRFKHALTQQVAYNSVLVERRKLLHARTAEAIESLQGERVDDCVAELAHHYRRSANLEKALEYLQRAGHQAARRSANAEAIEYLTAALDLLSRLPEGRERD